VASDILQRAFKTGKQQDEDLAETGQGWRRSTQGFGVHPS
jgi:hypothetical protein